MSHSGIIIICGDVPTCQYVTCDSILFCWIDILASFKRYGKQFQGARCFTSWRTWNWAWGRRGGWRSDRRAGPPCTSLHIFLTCWDLLLSVRSLDKVSYHGKETFLGPNFCELQFECPCEGGPCLAGASGVWDLRRLPRRKVGLCGKDGRRGTEMQTGSAKGWSALAMVVVMVILNLRKMKTTKINRHSLLAMISKLQNIPFGHLFQGKDVFFFAIPSSDFVISSSGQVLVVTCFFASNSSSRPRTCYVKNFLESPFFSW